MTWMVHSIAFGDAGDDEQAAFYFRKSTAKYVRGPFYVWHEGANLAGGAPNFVNGAGMYLLNVVAGFGGVRLSLETGTLLLKRPRPPPNCTKLVLRRVFFRGVWLNLEATAGSWSVMLDEPAPPGVVLRLVSEGDESNVTLSTTRVERPAGSSGSIEQLHHLPLRSDDDDGIPAWTAPPFDPNGSVNQTMAYGMPVVQNTGVVKIFNGSSEMGVYAHQAMISVSGGFFLATWINAAHNESQPGQRVLWSYAREEEPLTSWATPAVAFPNMSLTPCENASEFTSFLTPACATLNSEPTVVLNGRVYLAASTRQFCLYPLDKIDENGKYLLLRQVTLSSSSPKLGEVFWAADPGPAFSATNERLGIRSLSEMDASIQGDVAELLGGARPCEANSTKCEFCEGGCQDMRSAEAADAPCKLQLSPSWRERTHWLVPHKKNEEVIVYRSPGSALCYSVRSGVGGDWSVPRTSKLADIHSNTNAGTLPDGRVYLLHNPVLGDPPPGTERDPLVLSLSSDGYRFDQAFVALSCRLPPVAPTKVSCKNAVTCPHLGCHPRNRVGGAAPGPQYPQGLVHKGQLFVILSNNKEDIWVERIPLSALGPRGSGV